MRPLLICLLVSLAPTSLPYAKCVVSDSKGNTTLRKSDALFELLSLPGPCIQNALDLKSGFQRNGAAVMASMVANRGRHNPPLGSFSFFDQVLGTLKGIEIEEGDLFFGHFTTREGQEVVFDQAPERGKLMIEAIAWDSAKGLYNFYELIGNGSGGTWFYRGDSSDILKDNTYVYRAPPPGAAQFGNRLRCSACHASGGPIMKELNAPHNDWWTRRRPLPLSPNRPSQQISAQLQWLTDASDFAKAVKAGINKLDASASYQRARQSMSLQERLRPLFCENEINLESDLSPNEDNGDAIQVPSSALLNPLLGDVIRSVSRRDYLELVRRHDLRFPETSRADADHAWLTPVKSYADLRAIVRLIDEALISDRFVKAVLSIDLEHPLFSRSRCALLSLVPNQNTDWENQFRLALLQSNLDAAKELLALLEDNSFDGAMLQEKAQERNRRIPSDLLFQNLLSLRTQVGESEISKNPRGQILEPGFRVIFPETL